MSVAPSSLALALCLNLTAFFSLVYFCTFVRNFSDPGKISDKMIFVVLLVTG